MNTKLFKILFLCLIYLSCSDDDSIKKNEPCVLYFATIVTEKNNCDCDNLSCAILLDIFQEEFLRLLIENETYIDTCPRVNVMTSSGDLISGYLLTITQSSCSDFNL